MSVTSGHYPNIDSQAVEFLHSHYVANVATVDMAGIPNQAVIYYAFEPDTPYIYFLTKTESRKLEQLKQNNHISMLISDIQSMTTLELFGEAEIIDDSSTIITWVKQIVGRVKQSPHPDWLPVLQTDGMGLSLVKIVPEQWVWSQFSQQPVQK